MSRFYDALREASRPPAGKPQEDSWEAKSGSTENAPPLPPVFEVPRMPESVPPIAITPEPSGNAAAAVKVAPQPRQADTSITPEDLLNLAFRQPAAGATAKSELWGSKAGIKFDAEARLLPHSTESVVLEHYRRLRTKILQQHEIKPFRTVVIVSASPQEGKTVTTMNLGLSFAMLPSFKVLVIDGDLRRGTIGKWIGVSDEQAGFSDLIEGTADLDDVILRCESTTAQFMVRGKSQVSPAELLHSPRLSSLLRRMGEHYDLILVDSAPLSLVTDAQLLAGNCDAVILAARAFYSSCKSVEQTTKELDGVRIIGAVLNGGMNVKSYRNYNGYYQND